jgi:hypothetical protein
MDTNLTFAPFPYMFFYMGHVMAYVIDREKRFSWEKLGENIPYN